MTSVRFKGHCSLPLWGKFLKHPCDQKKAAADVTEFQGRVALFFAIDTVFVVFCVVQKNLETQLKTGPWWKVSVMNGNKNPGFLCQEW